MKRTVLGVSLIVVTLAGASGQTAGTPLTFEVASVKAAPPPAGDGIRIRMGGDPGRLDYSNVSMKMCIAMAYRVKDYQISGPDWLDSQRYDIVAKLPEGAKREQAPEMMQALLAERFKLVVHRDKKELPVYGLVVGKSGAKIKQVEVPNAPAGPGGPGGPRGFMKMGRGQLEAKEMTVANFADMLSRLVDRPVVDMTDLKGAYDFKLEFTPEGGGRVMQKMAMEAGLPPGGGGQRPAEGGAESGGPSIFTAVQEQLGLKLDARKAPLEILVIDHAEKVPTEN